MKFTTTAVLLAAAIGATAHPSGHAHRNVHRSIHERDNFYMNKKPAIPLPSAPPAEEKTHVAAAAVPKPKKEKAPKPAEPKKEKKPANKQKPSKGKKPGKAFCGGQDYTKYYDNNSKRATVADIFYKGNIGAPNNYGCNIQQVDAATAESYDHLATFTNVADSTYECACFNKIGPKNNEVNGFFNGNEALKFKVSPGEDAYIVADDNTQGGCACGPAPLELTSFGEFAGTWLEWDLNSKINGGWSGADASCLVAAALGHDIPGMKVCGHDTCSTIYPGGTGENAYLGGMEDLDGIGLNIYPGQVRLQVDIGYTGGK